MVFFKNDRIYRHNILRVNYTTYDVRRKQDTINPRTAHQDIMVLGDGEDDADHPYLYARVIGIFHANIIYTGSLPADYCPRRLEFLWVQWYKLDPKGATGGWGSSTLDRLCFPSMVNEASFGFLDPADVVRGCHIMPLFRRGMHYDDRKGLSPCAKDSNDWSSYYLNR